MAAIRGWLRRLLLGLAVLFLGLPGASHAQDARAQIGRKLSQAERDARAASIPEKAKPRILSDLAGARRDLDANRLYLATEKFLAAATDFRALEFMTDHEEAARKGLPAFETAWSREDRGLRELEKRYRRGNWASQSAALRALAESNFAQARPLYQGSHEFALTSPQSGFYYLGNAREALEAALLCQSLHFPPAPRPRKLRSFAPEIRHLEKEVLTAYKPPQSIERHGDFIRINGSLKAAEEMDQAQLFDGALYKYLQALRLFALLDARNAGTGRTEDSLEEISRLRTRLSSAPADDSIVELLLEQAEAALEPSGDGGAAGDTRTASVLLKTAIPAYYAAVEHEGDAGELPATGEPVTVTLVRWPYT